MKWPSQRTVRREYRKELIRYVSEGARDFATLLALTEQFFRGRCAWDAILISFCRAQLNVGLSLLRREGRMMSVGREWKLVEELTQKDVQVIAARTQKRVSGELRELETLAHKYGLLDLVEQVRQARQAMTPSKQQMLFEV